MRNKKGPPPFYLRECLQLNVILFMRKEEATHVSGSLSSVQNELARL
jgi:hypothetical protein